MTDTDPVAYLRNAHARVEDLARAATPGPWRQSTHIEHGFRVEGGDGNSWVAWTGALHDEPESSRPDSEFIAANSPDTVLARVAAERQILVWHQLVEKERPAFVPNEGTVPCCGTCWGETYPCRTVRLLAAGWGWTEEQA